MTDTPPMPGDEVLVRGTVMRHIPGVGALVEFFSKTDQYEAWVNEESIAEVIVPNVPGEPPDDTWIGGRDPRSGKPRVFVRNAALGVEDLDRRHPRRWWDIAAEEAIGWPQVLRRGGHPNHIVHGVTEASST